jgi:hypothetical protein
LFLAKYLLRQKDMFSYPEVRILEIEDGTVPCNTFKNVLGISGVLSIESSLSP